MAQHMVQYAGPFLFDTIGIYPYVGMERVSLLHNWGN